MIMMFKRTMATWACVVFLFSMQTVFALDVQLQLQLTTDGTTAVNDAKLSVAAASFLAIKHFNTRTSSIIEIGENCSVDTQLNVEIVDTMSDEKVALGALLTKTMANQPDVIVGALTSYETVPLALAASVQNVPIISYGATSQRLDDSDRYSTFLRTIPSDKTVAEAVCRFFSFLGYEYISILYADDEYGSAYKDAVTASCRDLNVQARAVSFQIGNVESVQDAVSTLLSFESNIVVAIAFETDVAVAVHQAFEIGMIGEDKLWVFTDAADTSTLQNVVAAEPNLAEALHGNFRILAAGAVRGYGQFDAFSEQWKGIGVDSSGQLDLDYINDKFDEVNFPGAKLTSAFFQGPDSSIDAAAAYVYDALFAAGIAACEAQKGGVPLDLLNALRDREPSVKGVSGQIEFAENGSRSPQSAYFAVQNLVMASEILTFPTIGNLDDSGKLNTIVGMSTLYPGSSTIAPLDRAIVIPEFNYVSDAVIIGAWIMVVLLLLLTFSMLFWVFTHWNSRVVKHSQGLFLVTLLVGTLLSSATIVPLVTDDQNMSPEIADLACMAAPWLYSLGFVLTFAALFAKTYRIARIFNNKKMSRIRIKNRDLFAMVAVLIMLDSTFLGAWQATAPLSWEREVTDVDSFNRTVESFGKCTDNVTGNMNSTAFVAMLAALHATLLIVGNVYAYKARNVPTTFQESRWIGLAMASMLQLFLMGVPVVLAVADDPTARTLVMISVIFLNNFVLVGAITFPKIYVYYFLRDGEGMGMTTTNSESNGGIHMGKTESQLNVTFENDSYSQHGQPASRARLELPDLASSKI